MKWVVVVFIGIGFALAGYPIRENGAWNLVNLGILFILDILWFMIVNKIEKKG